VTCNTCKINTLKNVRYNKIDGIHIHIRVNPWVNPAYTYIYTDMLPIYRLPSLEYRWGKVFFSAFASGLTQVYIYRYTHVYMYTHNHTRTHTNK